MSPESAEEWMNTLSWYLSHVFYRYIYFWVSVFDYNHYHHFNPKLYNYHLRVKEELLDISPPCFPCSNPLSYALNSTCFYAEYKAAEKQLQRQDNVATILCVSHTSLFFRFISRQRANSFAQQFVSRHNQRCRKVGENRQVFREWYFLMISI